MKSSSRALGQRFTGFAPDNFHSVASPAVFERIVFRYGLAVLSVAIALGVKLILLHFNFPYPLSTSFLLAIAITFWYAGTGPGILSVLLSFIAFAFFVLPYQVDYRIVLPDGSTKPVYVSGVTASHIQYFFYFALLALLMSWFSSSRRRAEQSLSQARRELETKVEERTAKLSRANEELQTEIIERKSAEEKLQRSKAFLSEGQRISHTGSWSWNVSSGKVTWSGEHFRIFGFDSEKTQPSFQLFLETVHPEDRSFIERSLDEAIKEKRGFDLEFRIALADGSIKHVQGVGRPVLGKSGEVDRYNGTTVDITERKRGEALFTGEKRLLEMIATGVALEEILNSLCLIIEDYRSGTLASVLLLRSDGTHLDSVAGPSLPKGWREEMEKLPIGPCAGSCGTAAYRGSAVIVSDIATDPLWEVPEHRNAALSHGLRASWSNPILSSEGKVLGTFCIYERETRSPSAHDLELIEKATYLARVAIERDRAETDLRTSEQKYRDLIDASPDAICVLDADSKFVMVNPAGIKLAGRPEEELIGSSVTETYLPAELHLFRDRIEKLKGEGSFRFERKFVRDNGEVIPVEVSLSALRGQYYQAIIRDIGNRKRREALLAGENRVLEMLAKGDSLADILDNLCVLVEEQSAGVIASILLMDPNGKQLRHGGAPNLPKTYTEAIDGAFIGPSVGSCGTAAYRAEQVIVSDIAVDPLWVDFRELALSHSLRACWSTPIFSSEGKVIGTFAMYYREPRSPSSREQDTIKHITHLAGIAIQRKLAEAARRESEAYLAEAQRLSHTGSWAWAPATGEIRYWSEERLARKRTLKQTIELFTRTARSRTSTRWDIRLAMKPVISSSSWARLSILRKANAPKRHCALPNKWRADKWKRWRRVWMFWRPRRSRKSSLGRC